MAIVLEETPLLGPTNTSATGSSSSLDEDCPEQGLQRHRSGSFHSHRHHDYHDYHNYHHHHHGRRHARSAGVARAEIISAHLSRAERLWIFWGIFLIGYAYGLESQVRSTYLPYATASFSMHSYLATINVLRSVVAVAVQPTAAKIADIFGRFEVVIVSTAFYVSGMMIEATSTSVYVFCFGTILYQIGFTCIVLLLEILIADFSSMRARVFFSYVPALPFIVNTWISGTITSAILSVTTWRVGIGMWCVIYPVASLPLLVTLYSIDRRIASSHGHGSKGISSTFRLLRQRGSDLLEQLDAVGLVVLITSFSLILAPLTIAGGTVSQWQNPRIMAPLCLGLGLVPVFVIWERKGARTPLVPFHLLKDRGLWSALAVRSLLNLAWYVQANYLYTVLVVAFDFTIESSTRILSFYSFFGVVSGVAVGWVVYRVRRLKLVIVMGTCLFMAALAVSIKFPGGASSSSKAGIVSSQILLGLAGGFFAYPTQASIQASASRDHVAILTGLYLSFYNVGSALGTCLAGAIWTQTLYPALQSGLSFQSDPTLARRIYESPFEIVSDHPVGTDIRDAIIRSYSHVQRLLCITAVFVCVPMILFALALRNPKLSDRQVQEEAETMEERDDEEEEEIVEE
ncbi:Siderophore iron transporter 1 [Escovopsis weberi]|uniref:Siderophore iron transporter 1 n=1 Tax=Escovopsis weberi TaxID=150374 RepID=A0A0M9VWU4_ESCWE|nr:Siderophore iron transporter 1 [Escovopsis weberi]